MMFNDLIIEFYLGVIILLSVWWFKSERKVFVVEMDRYFY